jgi:hypothetical protein
VIAALSTALVGYWQFVYKPAQEGGNLVEATYSGRVLSAQLRAFVPGSAIAISLDNGKSGQATTDVTGEFTIDLGKQKRGTRGKVYIHANGFDALEKDFVIDNSRSFQEFRLEVSKDQQPKGNSISLVIAGRVVDSATNVGVGQTTISLAGRTETYLTDDNGNFRIVLLGSPPNELRLSAKREGCTAVDRAVKPGSQNLILQMRCKTPM